MTRLVIFALGDHGHMREVRNGRAQVADGPFTETKEQLGGDFLIRVSNLDEAIALVSRIPGSRRGTAEIRPLFPSPQRLDVKGTATCKYVCRGMWVASDFESDPGGVPCQGHGMDGYDQLRKKYIGYWFDSMTSAPVGKEELAFAIEYTRRK